MRTPFNKILLLLAIIFIVVSVLATPTPINAQDAYIPISPVPNLTDGGSGLTLESYLNNAFTFALGIATILAIIKIALGGIAYMTSKSAGGSEGAKKTILNAVVGLLLLLSTFIILKQINPDILRLEIGEITQPTPPINTE